MCLQKAKDESKEVNGEDEGEEEKSKTASSSKKAPAAEKKITEKKGPAKKRAPKKVPPILFLNMNSPHMFCRIQRSPARTLLMRSMTSRLMRMNLRNLKLRSERYARHPNMVVDPLLISDR